MDIEQVKLIVDLIKDLGVQGKEGLIWWLVIKEVLPLVAWTSFGFTVITLAYQFLRGLGWENEMKEIRRLLCPHFSGYMTSQEYFAVIQEIQKLKGKGNGNAS